MRSAGRIAIYLTHPEVVIDPAIAIPDWGLSPQGAGRVQALAQRFPDTGFRIVSSAERKALETAWPLSARCKTAVDVRPGMHENDRSTTGFLPGPEFERTADRFFAEPTQSVGGWERAGDAQARIVDEAKRALRRHSAHSVLFTGHGGVGTLLYCALAGHQIDRKWDQKGGGHWFAFDPDTLAPFGHWVPMETLFQSPLEFGAQ